MIDWLPVLDLLAADPPKPQENQIAGMLMPLLFIGALFYFIILRPQNRERRKHEDMLKQLKKNDRVVTIGGIIGSVANIGADGKEVTIKVEDNTRIKFLRSSIQRVLTEESDEESSKQA